MPFRLSRSGGGGGGGLSQAYQTVQDEGTPLTQRSSVNFVGPSVTATDNAGTSTTDVTIRVQAERKRTLWAPTGMIDDTSTGGRGTTLSNQTNSVSGTLRVTGGAVIPAGVTVSSIRFYSGATAGATLSNQWFCLIRLSDLAVLAKTADDTTTAWPSNTGKTLSLTAGTGAYTPTSETAVYIGIVVVATTMPTMSGFTMFAADVATGPPVFGGPSTTGLTNPASLGATAAAVTSSPTQFYAQLF